MAVFMPASVRAIFISGERRRRSFLCRKLLLISKCEHIKMDRSSFFFYNSTGLKTPNGISPTAARTNALTLGESIEYAFT